MHKVSDEKQAALYRSINRFLRKKNIIDQTNPLKFGSFVHIQPWYRWGPKEGYPSSYGYVGGMRRGSKGPAILLLTEEVIDLSVPGLTVDWKDNHRVEHLVDWCWIKSVSNEHDIHILLTSKHAQIQQLGVELLKQGKTDAHST